MKKILNVLLLGMLMCAAFAIIIVANKDSEKPSEIQTRTETRDEKTVNTTVYTRDHQGLEFEIVYEGKVARSFLEGYVQSTVRRMIFQKNMLEILKYNTLEHLTDSIKYYITPMDSTFRIFLFDTKYHLSSEVRELWDEYIKAKTEEAKAEEKARNLEILYGE